MSGEGQELTPKKQATVRFRGENGDVREVSLSNLKVAYDNIQSHKGEFSLGGILAKGRSLSSDKSRLRELGGTDPLSVAEDAGEALGETIGIIYDNSFISIGIHLDSAKETGGLRVVTKDGDVGAIKIKLRIQNLSLFLSFLDALEAVDEEILKDNKIPLLVGEIGSDLFRQVYEHYMGFKKDDKTPLIASRLDEIVSRYRKLRIKLQDYTSDPRRGGLPDLETFALYSQQGILQEYINASSNSLLLMPDDGEDSPAKWQKKNNPQEIQHRWKEAVSILSAMRENPKAQDFSNKVKANLMRCLEIAIKDIESQVDDGRGINDKKRTILEKARQELRNI